MLGITLADAVLVSTLTIAVLAAWRGAVSGTAAKDKTPPENQFMLAGAAFADTTGLRANTNALVRLSEAAEHIASIMERQIKEKSFEELDDIRKQLAALQRRR